MKKRAVPQKKQSGGDDSVIYKIMIALGMLCILLLALQLVSRSYRLAGPMMTIRTGLGWAAVIAGVLTVVLAAGWLTQRRRAAFWRTAALPLMILCLLVALSSLVLYVTWVSYVGVLYFVYIAAAVLYMVALLYQPEFLLLSLLNTCAGCVFFALSRLTYGMLSARGIVLSLVLVLAAAAATALTFAARKKPDGILKLLGRPVHLACADTSPLLLYVTAVVWVVCLVAVMVLGAVFAYYCVYAAVALELVAAVYYTVKLS